MFAGKKSAQIREILISESAWEEMTCLFAPSLGIVAEGVENNEQFELLKNMNCDEFQGYYYSKPLSGDQLIDFLRGQKK